MSFERPHGEKYKEARAALQNARERFEALGLHCESEQRGGLYPTLVVRTEAGDVHVDYQYNRIVATERIPGVQMTTAGFGEYNYQVHFPENT